MKISIDENIPFLADLLTPYGTINLFQGRNLNNKCLKNSESEILFIRSTTKVNKDLLHNTNVNFVGTATTGVDHIDAEYLQKSNITLANASGSNSNSVAELVIYSILSWIKINSKNLYDLKIGIIGFGNIGKLVAKYSSYLGLKILVNDPPLLDKNYKFPDYVEYVDLKTIFKESDIITNHVPLIKTTKYPTYNMINRELLELIKESSLFVHTSRGGVVNEKDFLDLLKYKNIYPVFDVWENEPLVNKELANKCFLATPHIGGYSFDGKLRGVKMMVDAFQNFKGQIVDMYNIQLKLDEYRPVKPEKFSDIDYILNLIQNNRKFSEDYNNFLKSLNLSDFERAKAFDLLRKSYPQRRESL